MLEAYMDNASRKRYMEKISNVKIDQRGEIIKKIGELFNKTPQKYHAYL